MQSVITGWGMSVPKRILTNADLEKMVETNDEWIVSRTGIRERRIASADETPSTLALAASQEALHRAGITADEIDLIVVATVTGDYSFPSVANLLQANLGARCGAFDVGAACSGFVYALVTAHHFLAAGTMKHVLVVGSETLSRIIDYRDRSTCVLFGDGAGAVVLSATADESVGVRGWTLGSDGSQPELLCRPAGGSKMPITAENIDTSLPYVQMSGSDVFKFATRVMGSAMEDALAKDGLTKHDVDLLIPHQANQRIIDAAMKRLELPPEKVFVNIDRYGNSSAASVPIALYEALAEGRIKDGDLIGMVAFGGGLTWGAIAMRWTTQVVQPEHA